MRVFITGATGVIGTHLIDLLVDQVKANVWALRRSRTAAFRESDVTYIEGDVTDYISLSRAMEKVRANVVFHLAAQSYTGPSFAAPQLTWEVNVEGTLNLLEAIRLSDHKPDRILIASSAAAYGEQIEFPTTEQAVLHPVSPYGCTKAAQDMMGYQYFRAYGLPIIRTRSYIHIGTRQGLHNAVQAFSSQIAAVEAGLQELPIRVGNLDPRRDILDVRDAVSAFWALIERGEPGEAYNVCSEEAYRIRDLLDELRGLSTVDIKVEQDLARLRATDPPLEVGSNRKLMEATGWKPHYAMRDSLEWILNWRRELMHREPLPGIPATQPLTRQESAAA